jgi:anti-anti-sigma factor
MPDASVPPSGLAITATGSTRYVTVVVSGHLDRATAPRLEACLERLRALGCSRLVLDLAGVPFVDSAGLGVLFHAAKGARHRGGAVTLRHASRHLLRLLDITHLAVPFSIEPSVKQVA